MPFDIPHQPADEQKTVGTDFEISHVTQQSKSLKAEPTSGSYSSPERADCNDSLEFAFINRTVEARGKDANTRDILGC